MFLVTSNKSQRLLCLHYLQRVTPADLETARPDLQSQLAEMPPDFRLIADMSLMESMDQECTTEIGHVMDLFNEHGVGLILRVITDPGKDIGMNILSVFHYTHPPRVVNCDTMADALKKLAEL